jgi:hypothetical protein
MSFLIKIGGSLIPGELRNIAVALDGFCKNKQLPLYIFPGGGEFANLIRNYRSKNKISDETTHKMALASLDQNAYLIADICRWHCCCSIKALKKGDKFPIVIAPYQIINQLKPFKGYDLNIDRLSSDSSAIYLAHLLKAHLIVATDVDGVYDSDYSRKKEQSQLLTYISAGLIANIPGGGPLDNTLGKLIEKYNIDTWVINGRYPQRIIQILENKNKIKGTFICAR